MVLFSRLAIIVSLLLVSGVLSERCATAQTPQCKTLACLEKAVAVIAERSLAKNEFVGMSIVVVDRDKGSFQRHFGMRDLENATPTNRDTIYELGSITKPLTFLTLAVQDKVSIDDSIGDYLPGGIRNPKPGGKEIKFKHFVSHTSEIPSRVCVRRKANPKKRICYGFYPGSEDPYKDVTEEKFFQFINDAALMFEEFPEKYREPGKYRYYSNAGAALVGELVARAHHVSYETFLRREILEPLKMRSSFLSLPCSPLQDCSKLAKVYTRSDPDTPWWQTAWRTAPFAKGSGRLKSTPADMEKLLSALLAPEATPLAEGFKRSFALLEDVTASHNGNICDDDETPKADRCNLKPRKLYWGWPESRQQPIFYHTGTTTGSQSMIAFSRSKGFGVVILSNSRRRDTTHYNLAMCIMAKAGKRPMGNWCAEFSP